MAAGGLSLGKQCPLVETGLDGLFGGKDGVALAHGAAVQDGDGLGGEEFAVLELHLSGVVFDRANLTGAELFRTPLTGMDLTTCTLDGIVLSQTCAELKGAKIHAAQAAVVARILGIEVEP